MTTVTTAPARTAVGRDRASHTARRTLGPTGSLVLLASLIVSLLASSSAPTPLYAVYQREWGFSPITTTVVFGSYAVAVLLSLLVLGRISDHVGRRPVLFAALALQVVAMAVFAVAGDVATLLTARVLQGIATGAASAAIGAALLDVDRARGTISNSVAPGIGTGGGAILSALVVQYLPAPTHLVYLLLIAVFVLQAVALLFLRESVATEPGALASLSPEVRLPRTVRRAAVIATPVLFAVWSLAGFYAALGPALLGGLVHSHSAVYGGLPLGLLAGSAAVSVFVLRNIPTRTVMYVGVLALIAGVAATLVAVDAASVAGYLAGTVVAGIGFGSGFQGGIRLVVPQVEAHERAGVLALLYVVSYLGLGVPAVIGGVLVVDAGGLLTTTREYGLAVIVLALGALVGLLLNRPAPAPCPRAASVRA
ncbi:MAG: MFS transporter [Jatrophihabitans sp.]|uniref:MFS transporter n=1 Tax=Jatrophihabitans sp. TaxID=1932789 RepID=UPI003F7D00C3